MSLHGSWVMQSVVLPGTLRGDCALLECHIALFFCRILKICLMHSAVCQKLQYSGLIGQYSRLKVEMQNREIRGILTQIGRASCRER